MKIGLKDFRAFAYTGAIEIKPLTFVVGENSSGKTSFLAALSYMWRFQQRLQTASFNQPPFDLGTFDEIVHRVRGRTRPDCFMLTIENNIVIDPKRPGRFRTRPLEERSAGLAKLSLTFESNVGDADIRKLILEYGELRLVVSVADEIAIQLFSGIERIFDSIGGEERLPLPRSIGRTEKLDLTYIEFYMRRLLLERVGGKEDGDSEASRAFSTAYAALEHLIDSFPRAVFASAPVRSNPSRVYTPTDQSRSPDGTHTPQALFKIKESDEARWLKVKAGLEEFGHVSGMFNSINVSRYKKSGSSPFQINVTFRGKQSNLVDVGYGVSQALPILTDLIESPPRSGFLFQQPEVHLHPQAQAALGTFFAKYLSDHRAAFIVAETHSDYLIDRIRIEVKNGKFKASDVTILYFESSGTDVNIHQIGLDSEGNIINAPIGYRDFFIIEQMKMLGLEYN